MFNNLSFTTGIISSSQTFTEITIPRKKTINRIKGKMKILRENLHSKLKLYLLHRITVILFRVNFLIFPLAATWTTYPIVCKLCNSDEFSVPPQQVALVWLFRLFKFKIIWTLLASGFFNLARLFEFEIIWILFVSGFCRRQAILSIGWHVSIIICRNVRWLRSKKSKIQIDLPFPDILKY